MLAYKKSKTIKIDTILNFIIFIIFFLYGLGLLTCSGIDALPSFSGASASLLPRVLYVRVCFGSLVLSIFSRWLIQFCLYFSLTSCIPEISSSCLMSSLLILSSLVYPVTLLRKRISAASRLLGPPRIGVLQMGW